jgi:hypothetical protein
MWWADGKGREEEGKTGPTGGARRGGCGWPDGKGGCQPGGGGGCQTGGGVPDGGEEGARRGEGGCQTGGGGGLLDKRGGGARRGEGGGGCQTGGGVPDGGERGGGEGGDGRVSEQRGMVKLAAWIMCACGMLGPLVLHPLPHQWSRLC